MNSDQLIREPKFLNLLNELNPKWNPINVDILIDALTHPSYANEHGTIQDNQKLEFLGDAMLNAIIAIKLYDSGCNSEGEMTKKRAALVNARTCCRIAKKIHLDNLILLGNGFKNKPIPDAILADAIEAVIGAGQVMNGGDSSACIKFISKWWDPEIEKLIDKPDRKSNPKGYFQEYCQKNQLMFAYVVQTETSPFEITLEHQDLSGTAITTRGIGNTKKEAQQDAADKMLNILNIN